MPPPPPPPPLPQPIPAMPTNMANRTSIASQLRRRFGTLNRNASAKTAPPVDGQNRFKGLFKATGAVVLTVNVVVCAVVPLMITGTETKHEAGSLAAVGVTAQLTVTVPVNPFAGVTAMVEVLPVVAPGMRLIAVPDMEKEGASAVVKERMLPLVVPTLFCATA